MGHCSTYGKHAYIEIRGAYGPRYSEYTGPPEAFCGWSGPAVGDEVINKSYCLAIFSSQEALSLHFCFKVGALII